MECLDYGQHANLICNDLYIRKSTSNDRRRNRRDLELHDFSVKKIINALWIWLVWKPRRGTVLSGPILEKKAIQSHKKFSDGVFLASLVDFHDGHRSRPSQYRVPYLSMCGEIWSTNQNAVNKFPKKFADVRISHSFDFFYWSD